MSTTLQKLILAGTEFEAHRKKFDRLADRIRALQAAVPSLSCRTCSGEGRLEFEFLGHCYRLAHVAAFSSEGPQLDSVVTLSLRQGPDSFVTLRRDRLEGAFLVARGDAARWHIDDAADYFMALLFGPPSSEASDSEEEPYEAMAPLPAAV